MPRDIPALVAELTLDEKAAFLAGEGLWSTVACERLGIPAVNVTDGPNGARGPGLPGEGGDGMSAFCAPCGSALGATWNVALVERIGAVIGAEARTKACRVLLGPTVNIHRSPLAGRNFECYSEDPLLSGKTAAAFVRGVQSAGRRHHGEALRRERRGVRTHDDQLRRRRAHAPRDHARAVRARGARRRRARHHDRVQPAQRRVLRGARLAPGRRAARRVGLRGVRGLRLVRARIVGRLDTRPGSTSRCRDRAASTGPRSPRRCRTARSTRRSSTPRSRACFPSSTAWARSTMPRRSRKSIDRPEHRTLARDAAAESMVLLKNDDGMLPIDRSSIATLAVVGPNAERARIMGGGSASFTPHYRVPPLDALQEAVGDRREDRLRAGLRHRAHHPADRRRLRHHRRRRRRADPAAGRPAHLAGRVARRRHRVPRHRVTRPEDGRTACAVARAARPDARAARRRARPRRRHRSTAARPRALRDGERGHRGHRRPRHERARARRRVHGRHERSARRRAGGMPRAAALRPHGPRRRRCRRRRRDDRGRRHQRRLGVRGSRSRVHGAPRRPGRADPARRRRQPPHRRDGERGVARHHGLGRRGARGARDLVRRPGDGERAGRRAVRRDRSERTAAHHVSRPARTQPVVRQLPR